MKLTANFLASRHAALGPAWRYLLAQELALSPLRLECADVPLAELVRFLHLADSSGGEVSAAAASPLTASALAIHASPALVDQLKIMLLGRLETLEILQRTGLEADAFARWQELFFDIDAHRENADWLVRHVIAPERKPGRSSFAGKLGIALRGGPDGARLVLDVDAGLPLKHAARLEREELLIALKRDQVLNMEIAGPQDAACWFKIFSAHELAVQRLALETRKLEFQCAEQLRRQQVRDRREQEAQNATEQRRRRDEQRKDFAAQRAARAASSPLAQLKWLSARPPESVLSVQPLAAGKSQFAVGAGAVDAARSRSGSPTLRPAAATGQVPPATAEARLTA